MKGFSTKAVHNPFSKKDPHGALHPPIYSNAAFEFESSQEIADAFGGRVMKHAYSRTGNPTVEFFESKVKNITGANSVLALSSGMAAIFNLILTITKQGDNIVTTKRLFGNTYSLFTKTLSRFGLEVHYVENFKPETLQKAINEKTALLFLESINNPQLEVQNLTEIAAVCKAKNIPLVVDTTMTPLVFGSFKNLGVNIEVLSSTKYISGGATGVGGLIIDHGTFDWKHNSSLSEDVKKLGPFAMINRLRREVFRNAGSCLSPQNAWLHSLGIETLPLRVAKTSENAIAVAKFLSSHPAIKNVNYPGLENSPYHAITKSQFGKHFGGVLTFELKDKESCFQLMDSLTFIRRATNFHDNRSLIIHPASTIFCEFDPATLKEMGVPNEMIRLSVGIEEIEDLLEELQNALEKLR